MGIENGEENEGFEFDKAELHEAVKLYVEDEAKAIEKYGNIEDWNTGAIDDFSELFCGETKHVCKTYGSDDLKIFNADISKWDVSQATSFKSTFLYANLFNSDLSKWVVDRSIDMSYMFYFAETFNSDLSKWKVDHVTNFNRMFRYAKNFNSNISKWNVGRVISFEYMFSGAEKFNLNLCHWNMHDAPGALGVFSESGCSNELDPTPSNACYEC